MTVLQNVPLGRITDRARAVTFVRTVLTIIAGVLFGIGWLIARVWLALAWCAVAAMVGWEAGTARINADDETG